MGLTPEQEEQNIEAAFQEVLDGYLRSNHRKKVEIIKRAYLFAKDAHNGIRRRSGEPYILHPIAVAKIVSQEIGLGSTSICAALLHDVVEDTEYTVEDIELNFGKKIAMIVDGLTKISGGIFGDKASVQAENFRKLLLTMAEDIRVILIKMADRLHNMRTLGSMLPSKQYKIAGETLYIYAPLAHRLGLFAIKTELEDLSFKYQHPEQYKEIRQKIEETEVSRDTMFKNFSAPIRQKLDDMGLTYTMTARVKSAFSIWNKMETKHVPFEEVYDLYAVRIVFDCDADEKEKRICWNIYSAITDIYRLHPTRTRDWVSTPKANGYRALHLTVMGPDGNWVEVQIRSQKMDDIAERGFAAHWKYKIGESDEESELETWLKTITDLLREPGPNAVDFMDTIKLNLFATEIIVFTPKGDLITLPKDATVLDMAYTLHTEIGSHSIAGKVNHRLVPISYKLQSGDQVEVLTSKTQKPLPEWLNFVTTAKAKTRLETALKKERKKISEKGERVIAKIASDYALEDENRFVSRLMALYHLMTRDDLYFAIGNNTIELTDSVVKSLCKKQNPGLLNRLWPFAGKSNKKDQPAATQEKSQDNNATAEKPPIDTKKVYELRTENGMHNYKIAPCCKPIPGDDVVGYVDDDNNVVVHKMDCEVAMRLKSSFGNRLVATRWEESPLITTFLAELSVEGIDRMGILQELISEISINMSINIRKLDIEATEGVFSCKLVVRVSDVSIVNRLCKQIKKINGVKSAVRTS
ncbi:MAG TPA: bifunctional (p)ppGpp synthetase/guanosine-3',5'-bis(diphosphate) 3'-pyrophosphohydrolase [Candidatus Limisoma intestinavium]|uniref:Bifunctional (P)ppGpp synthetase/guanosine-3',5'-bis(Diphosphate) 3'-pyrophosphohydrolase n=1 Tax=Candidatus Limisoma intestinavium TaxID=2840856 RepID=A0A9D1LG94_9BACT|nr:bifunctional (p)ppGpp synthetase/guanosine-3',5'-bis(diphosphate) 3'-pyrophosphohydrolase [Candidatus Limisoma intestinavium]